MAKKTVVKVSKQIKQAMANAKLICPHYGYENRQAWLSALGSFDEFKQQRFKSKQTEVTTNEV